MDDQLLWKSFLEGNRESFEEIYSLYYKNLYTYGMRKINQPDIVRDCIQDLFVNLWTNRSGLGTTTNIKYYLLASLRNQLTRINTIEGRWKNVELSAAEGFYIQFNPESDYIRKENLSEKSG